MKVLFNPVYSYNKNNLNPKTNLQKNSQPALNSDSKFVVSSTCQLNFSGLCNRTFKSNAEFKRLSDANVLSKMPIFKNFSESECLKFINSYMNYFSDDAYRFFFSVVTGKKPAGLISSNNNTNYLNKLSFSRQIDLVNILPGENGNRSLKYNTFVLDKAQVLKIIENNKDIYTTRLCLEKNTNCEEIYKRLKVAIKQNNMQKINDIIGITLGFPVQNSLIFHLEKSAELDLSLRNNIDLFKIKLLRFFGDARFPYKNLPKEQLDKLRSSICNIKKIETVNNPIYDFVKYVDEPKEISRINQTADSYLKEFSINKIS